MTSSALLNLDAIVSNAVFSTATTVGISFRHFTGRSQFAWFGKAGNRNSDAWPRLGRFLLGRTGPLSVKNLAESSALPPAIVHELEAMGLWSLASVTQRDVRGITCLAVLDARPRDFEPATLDLLERLLLGA